MKIMTKEEYLRFLMEAPRTAHVSTVKEDGSPHVAPVWFTLDGDKIIFTTWHTTVKARNLRRDPRVAICVDDPMPPFSFVLVEGTAEVKDDLEALRYWAPRIAGRYMGPELAEQYGKRNAVKGELVVRVQMMHVVAHEGIAD